MSVSVALYARRLEPRAIPISRHPAQTMKVAIARAYADAAERLKAHPDPDRTMFIYDGLGGLRAEIRKRSGNISIKST